MPFFEGFFAFYLFYCILSSLPVFRRLGREAEVNEWRRLRPDEAEAEDIF